MYELILVIVQIKLGQVKSTRNYLLYKESYAAVLNYMAENGFELVETLPTEE